MFILHGKVASVFGQNGLSVHCQLRVIFSMLPIKSHKYTFKFVKVINRNTLSVIQFGYKKRHFR